MAIPTKDADLVAWSTNFDTKLSASPETYGETAATATAYSAVHDPFISAYTAASAEAQRNKSLVALKDATKETLLQFARMLYAQIGANNEVSDPAKVDLGIHLRSTPTPILAPTVAPVITVKSVFGKTFRLDFRNPETGGRRKPFGAIGISLFSFVGENPPTPEQSWHPQGNVAQSSVLVEMPETLEPGTKIWFTGFYYTFRGLSGVSSTPIYARIGFEGAEPLAA